MNQLDPEIYDINILPEQISITFVGEEDAGKTRLIYKICELIPGEYLPTPRTKECRAIKEFNLGE